MAIDAALVVQAVAARSPLPVSSTEFVVPTLIKVLPNRGQFGRLPVLVALLVEFGPGMEHERRSEQAVRAARAVIEGLAPDDYVSLTIYGERAKLVMPAEPVGDGSKVKRMLGFIDAHALGAGADLSVGLKAVADDLRRHIRPGFARRLLIFTATAPATGGATQDREAELLGRALAEEGIIIGGFGFGTDWNVSVLARLVDAGRGVLHYIPRSMDVVSAAREEVLEISSLAITDVRLRMRFAKGVRLRRFMQVFPTIAHWLPLQPSDREAVARVGELAGDRPCYVLGELVVPPQAAGSYRLATFDVSFVTLGGRVGVSDPANLLVDFSESAGPPQSEVARQLDNFQAYTLVEKALDARRAQDLVKARTLLENARRIVSPLRDHAVEMPLEQAIAALERGLPVSEALAKSLFFAARQPESANSD
jgi:hypothetical protein